MITLGTTLRTGIEQNLSLNWFPGISESMTIDAFSDMLRNLTRLDVAVNLEPPAHVSSEVDDRVTPVPLGRLPDDYSGHLKIQPFSRVFHYRVKRAGDTITMTADRVS